jgi:hypothetical protein
VAPRGIADQPIRREPWDDVVNGFHEDRPPRVFRPTQKIVVREVAGGCGGGTDDLVATGDARFLAHLPENDLPQDCSHICGRQRSRCD